MEQFKVKYKEEASELIAEIEKSLLLMEEHPEDQAQIEQIFRAMHTLKGNSSMFGFKIIAEFTHHLESLYEFVRIGKTKISKEILNVTLECLDHLSLLIDNEGIPGEKNRKAHETLTKKVIEIISKVIKEIPKNGLERADYLHVTRYNEFKTYHIIFEPYEDIFLNGTNPLYLINELHELGVCKITAHTHNIPLLEDCEAAKCYTSWDIYLTTDANPDTINEVFLFVQHRGTVKITQLEEENHLSEDPIPDATTDLKNSFLEEAAISCLPDTREVINKRRQIISSIRVPSERLDNLMSLVSELMTLQAKLSLLTEQNPQPELIVVTENLEKISTCLRDNAFSMCLVPVDKLVMPFHRLVRDLAAELNKEIEFIAEGTETELDKNIMEGLSDPLMHLLRNSIDHGIEEPDIRLKSGKPRQGKIQFKAFCAGTNVYIEIRDDGKGIDPGRIRAKAIEKGIIGRDDILNDKDLLNLIFLPGFSTAEQVSETSGRGVGMDVVKRKIADIRGQIKITSQLNKGTTITIKLPITMSIIDGLLVKIVDADFVIPLAAVDKCYEVPAVELLNNFNNLIVLGGEQIPFISLRDEFGIDQDFSMNQEMVIVNYDEKRVGLVVDSITGKFQAVLKPLGKYFQHMDNISGATILGDGKIALVLDTNKVTEQFVNNKNTLVCQ